MVAPAPGEKRCRCQSGILGGKRVGQERSEEGQNDMREEDDLNLKLDTCDGDKNEATVKIRVEADESQSSRVHVADRYR